MVIRSKEISVRILDPHACLRAPAYASWPMLEAFKHTDYILLFSTVVDLVVYSLAYDLWTWPYFRGVRLYSIFATYLTYFIRLFGLSLREG
jgi:hypothetical protein